MAANSLELGEGMGTKNIDIPLTKKTEGSGCENSNWTVKIQTGLCEN
jgi:hypothetical protein